MELLWVVGPVAVVVAVLLTVVWHRRLEGAARELSTAAARLGEARQSVREVREMGARTASTAGRLRDR